MTPRKRTENAAPPAAPVLSAVQAIFDPAGDIHVRAVAPSGRVYEIAPRVSFQIVAGDVDWFFHEWNSAYRQCLCRTEEYRPRQPQFNNGRQVEGRSARPQFENGEASRTARKEAPAQPQLNDGGAQLIQQPPEPVASLPVVEPEPEESTEPDPVAETGEGETSEDKE